MSENQSYNPFSCAAAAGLPAGLLFTAIVLCWAYSAQLIMLSFVALILILTVPYLAYRRLIRDQMKRPPVRVFQTVWIEGVYTFLFGGLIMALFVFVWLRYLDPDYLVRQLKLALELAKQTRGAEELAQQISVMLSHNMIPSAIESAMSIFWPVTFSGAILSLLLAMIVSRTIKKLQI